MTTRSVSNEDQLALLIAEPGRFYPVPGYEGIYEIDTDGNVRSLPRRVNSGYGSVRTTRSRMRKVRLQNGYPSFNARKDGRSHLVFIHRCLATLFIPNPDRKPCINHIDGNKANFALGNLEWCTHRENMRHAFQAGLTPFPESGPGDKSPAARLSWDDVRVIRKLAATGKGRQQLADQFGVCKSNINQIVRGETWKEPAP